MSPNVPMTAAAAPSFPRVSGDEPDLSPHAAVTSEFSPRERG